MLGAASTSEGSGISTYNINPHKQRNDDIEILRAVAVIGVILHHSLNNLVTAFPAWLGNIGHILNGGGGVDLFFVISGFVIGTSYVSKLVSSNFNNTLLLTKSFFIRRAFRIYPLAWTWLLLTLLAVYFFNSSRAFGSVDANIDATIAGILQFANYRFEQVFMRAEYGASFVYWSLSLEEQFYIILPIIMMVFRRFALLVLFALLAYKMSIITFHFAFRYEGLLLGMLLSQSVQSTPYRRFKQAILNVNPLYPRLASYGLIILLSLVLGSLLPESLQLSKFKFAAVLALIIVAIASCDNSILLRPGKLKRVFIWFGARSFALYLVHIPAFFTAREICYLLIARQQPGGFFVFLFIFSAGMLTLFFAECSYRFIETPMRSLGFSMSKKVDSSAHTFTNAGK